MRNRGGVTLRVDLSPFSGGQIRPHLERGISSMSETEPAHGIKLPMRGNDYGVHCELKEDEKGTTVRRCRARAGRL